MPESTQSFAERLGQWLDFQDALLVFSALQAGTVGAWELRSAGPSDSATAARQAFARVRDALVESVATGEVPTPCKAGIDPALRGPVESATDFAPYHRYYLARQRDMSASIDPLRASVRAALSRHSPPLRQLAALDAVMERALAARERELLAKAPVLLARRFEQLDTAHRAASGAQAADEPHRGMQPGGWLAGFCKEMQAVLLAELELRLQPIAGLIAAFDHEVRGSNE